MLQYSLYHTAYNLRSLILLAYEAGISVDPSHDNKYRYLVFSSLCLLSPSISPSLFLWLKSILSFSLFFLFSFLVLPCRFFSPLSLTALSLSLSFSRSRRNFLIPLSFFHACLIAQSLLETRWPDRMSLTCTTTRQFVTRTMTWQHKCDVYIVWQYICDVQ